MKEHNRDLTMNTSLPPTLPTDADSLSPCQLRRGRIRSGILDFLASHPGSTWEEVSLAMVEHSKRSIGDALTALASQGKITREKRTVYRYSLSPECLEQLSNWKRQHQQAEAEKPRKMKMTGKLVTRLNELQEQGKYRRAADVCLELMMMPVSETERDKYATLRSRLFRMAKGRVPTGLG